MVYKLNPEVGKIDAPVRIVWDGRSGNSEPAAVRTAEPAEWTYASGREAAEAIYDRHFNIYRYTIEDGVLVISVYEFCEPARR